MSAAPAFTLLCQCWGSLIQSNISGEDVWICEACGETTPVNVRCDKTEADCDLFDIPTVKLSVREVDGPARWQPDRSEFDHRDTFEDINPFTRTTKY